MGQYHFSCQDYNKALKYFEKAAGVSEKGASVGGSSQAKYQLGVMYYDGLGVEENPVSLQRQPHPPQSLCSSPSPHLI